MIKTIGAALILGAGTVAGFSMARRLNERCRLLQLWLRIIEIFKAEIYYQSRLLPEVFRRAAVLCDDSMMADVLRKLADSIGYGTSFEIDVVWRDFLHKSSGDMLATGDITILTDLGNYLGGTDREDQGSKLEFCKLALKHNLQLAEAERDRKTGVFRYSGFAVGAVLVLLLL